jgi:hypothetical protein
MRKTAIAFGMLVLLSACASPPRYDYVKEGVSADEKINASSECQYQIRLNKTAPAEAVELTKLCMQGKGFRFKRVG